MKKIYRVDEDDMRMKGFNLNEFLCISNTSRDIIFIEYEVVKETDKSYLFYQYGTPGIGRMLKSKLKRTPKSGKNLFAFDTKEGAMRNFIIRKEKQVVYLRNNIMIIEALINKAKKWQKTED